jgi:hypothetical protein
MGCPGGRPPELVRSLARVEEVRGLGIYTFLAHRIPTNRLHTLARFANTAKVNVIRRLPESRRVATLVAFASNLEATALDDALDLLDILITEIFSESARPSDRSRLRTIKDLDAAAVQLMQVCRIVLEAGLQDAGLGPAIFNAIEREKLEAVVSQVDSLVRPPEDVYYRELAGSYARVRRFLPHLLRTVSFDATPAGQPVLGRSTNRCRLPQYTITGMDTVDSFPIMRQPASCFLPEFLRGRTREKSAAVKLHG